eukprot:84972_1
MRSFLTFILICVTICDSYLIKTQYEYHYYNKSITCPDDENCEINCIHGYGCEYSNIQCPSNYNCTIHFSAYASGRNTMILAQNAALLTIFATNTYSAQASVIHGPQEESIHIRCDYYGCYQATIYASISNNVFLDCNDYRSCKDLQLFADHVSSINMSCSGSYSCHYLMLYQQSPPQASQTNIQCISSSSCVSAVFRSNSRTLTIQCGSSQESTTACNSFDVFYIPSSHNANATILCESGSCDDGNIYAIQGIFDVSVLSQTTQSNLRLYCGIDYYYSCALQPHTNSNNMLCDDTAFCMHYQYNPAKDYDIVIPSSYNKYNETITCDDTLDDCSIYCSHSHSCAYSDIICPQNNPNASCTIYCGDYACGYANIVCHNISSLIVYAKTTNALRYATIQASHVSNVMLSCSDSSSCQYMSLYATNGENIDIDCHGYTSCQYSSIVYESDGDYASSYTHLALVNVDCYGSYSCRSSTVRSNAGSLNVACNSDSSTTDGCQYTEIYCPVSSVLYDATDTNLYCDIVCGKTDSCIGLDVYSVNGWANTRISSINDQYPSSSTMHCDPGFSASCVMQGHVNSNEWFCDDSEICSYFRLDLNAQHIVTEREYQYDNKSIECDENKNCYVYCGQSSSCQYATIHCGNANCSIYCYGSNACKYASIIAVDSDVLFISASAYRAVAYSTLHAPSNTAEMHCSDQYACQYMTLHGTNTNRIKMECISSYSCGSQTIYAENCNEFYQECIGSYSCANSQLYQHLSLASQAMTELSCDGRYSCYQNVIQSSVSLYMTCGSDSSCQGTDVFIPDQYTFDLLCVNDDSCSSMEIYSHDGFINNDINITSYDDAYVDTVNFHCGNGYTNYCTLIGLINSDHWICGDITNYCYDFVMLSNNSTTDYIVVNYDRQYAHSYILCDQQKINCDVSCLSHYSCWNSKIICPNGTCSVYCSGSYACDDLEIYAVNGRDSVALDCNGNDAHCSGIIIFCTEYFNQSCTMDNNAYCDGFCRNYTDDISVSTHLDYSEPYYPNDSFIITSDPYKYYNQSIDCISDNADQCTIQCNTDYSCEYSVFRFIGTNIDCRLVCSSSHSCAYSIVNGDNCSSLAIIVDGYYGFYRATVYASNDQTVTIRCGTSNTCSYLELYQEDPSLALLQISQLCMGHYACAYQYWSIFSSKSTSIECLSSSSCRYSQYYHYSSPNSSWYCNGVDSCGGATIKTDIGNTLIQCATDGACEGSVLYAPTGSTIHCNHSDACISASIYSPHGSNTINIVSTYNNSLTNPAKLYCTPSYAEACTLQLDDARATWNCDLNNICYESLPNYNIIMTTYSHELQQQQIICKDDNHCYIGCDHDYGCSDSVIQCPLHYSCIIYCGYYGCESAIINAVSNGSLSLICYDSYACEHLTIYAIQMAMTVQCSTSYSCRYMNVFAETVPNLSMYCDGYYGCMSSNIYHDSIDSSSSAMYLNCQGSYACNKLLIRTNAQEARVVCNKAQQNDHGCISMNVYYTGKSENGLLLLCDNFNSCQNNNYHVSGGESEINVTSFSVSYADTNTLHCCQSWTASCSLKAQILSTELICNDRDSICASNNNDCPDSESTENIVVHQDYQYYNETIACSEDTGCVIICESSYACSDGIMYCRSGYTCDIFCLDEYSCDSVIIHAENATSLSLTATGSYSARHGTIYAPNNELNILCNGPSSCSYMQINAMYSYIDSLSCLASSSCQNMVISAEYSSYIDWSCVGGHSCSDSMIWHHNTSATYFGLYCDGYYACDDVYAIASAQTVDIECTDNTNACGEMSIYCTSAMHCNIACASMIACRYMDIYIAEPSKTLNITQTNLESDPNINLHCGLLYESECQLQADNETNSDELYCEESSVCNHYQIQRETTDYIVFEWAYWNYNRSVTCDGSKENCEVYCYGSNSCTHNTISCSNHYCKIYVGSNGCVSCSIDASARESFDVHTLGPYALQNTEIVVATNAIHMDCDHDYSCSSINIRLGRNETDVSLQCSSGYSCRYLQLFADNTNANISALCTSYRSCEHMKMYAQNAPEVYTNCEGSSSCRFAEFFASAAIPYDALDCVSTTSCTGLSAYCSYPSLEKVCVMQYESEPDIWICEGDICFYDDECEHYDGLDLFPNSGSILGGDSVVVTGPCYNPNVNYTCKFGTKQSHLHIFNNTHGYCITPPSSESGSVLFAVHEDNEWYGMISTFVFTDLDMNNDVELHPPIDVLYNHTVVNITWNSNGSDSHPMPQFVDINLYQIIPHIDTDGDVVAIPRFLLSLKSQVANNGINMIALNNTRISSANLSTDWDIFYGNLSHFSNILVVAIESTTFVDDIPMRRRKASNVMIQLYPMYNNTNLNDTRRRMIPVVGTLLAAYKIAWVGCKTWRYLDDLVNKDWWNNRRFPPCPNQDPSDEIRMPGCVGPWQPDPGCQNGGLGCKVWHTGAHNCIRSANGQQCCYRKDGSLCTEPPCAGTVDLSPVSQGVVKHFIVDVFPYILCRLSGNIDDYYARRPFDPTRNNNNGNQGRAAEACAPAGGDPHFVTFDLFNYTFNGIGDYYYLYHDNFKILVRMESFNNGSVMTKFGLYVESTSTTFNRSATAIVNKLEVSIDDEGQWQRLNVYMNGEIMLFTEDMHGMDIYIGDVAVNYNNTHNVIIRTHFGIFIEVWLRVVDDSLHFIEFTVDIDAGYKEQVTGLIGNYDDNDANDLQCRNGTILGDESTLQDIHYIFGLSWLLNEHDHNIFHNAFTSMMNPFDYKPLFGFADVDTQLLELAQETCGEVFECIFDVVATETVQIANTTLGFIDFVEKSVETIRTMYNVTEITIQTTPTPTFAGCDTSEPMNVYVLVDTNCNMTETECMEQDTFISSILQKVTTESDVDQLFGYIEYGNGAHELLSLYEYQSANESVTSWIDEATRCNADGWVNDPYYALQLASNGFTAVDNDYNNIILIISGCAPNVDQEHTCSSKQDFDDENTAIFVVNYRNSDSYSCLMDIDDVDQRMINVHDYSIDHVEYVLQNICEWNGTTTTTTTTTTAQPETSFETSFEDTSEISQILMTFEKVNSESVFKNSIVWILSGVIVVCGMGLLGCGCYVYRLKKQKYQTVPQPIRTRRVRAESDTVQSQYNSTLKNRTNTGDSSPGSEMVPMNQDLD